jgi:hypothetical protein
VELPKVITLQLRLNRQMIMIMRLGLVCVVLCSCISFDVAAHSLDANRVAINLNGNKVLLVVLHPVLCLTNLMWMATDC